jgi:hypothetical protein
MVAPYVRPLSISAGSAAVLVFIESAFLGSLPTLALAATSVGPFVPVVASALNRRRVVTQEDAQLVYEPPYEVLVVNKETILSSDKWGNIPMFQREKLDQIRKSARYSLLKSRTPAVEELCKSMDSIFDGQGDANRAASRIIGEMTGKVLGVGGDGVSFRGTTKDGSFANFDSSWTRPLLIVGLDPLSHWRHQVVDIASMDIVDKSNNIKGSLTFPMDEKKYRLFWESVEKEAKTDPEITKMYNLLAGLPSLVDDAQKQVLDKIKKSRSIF